MKKAYLHEVGDLHFPLEMDPASIKRDHELVGEEGRITPYAGESLRPHRGEVVRILGIIPKNGQIAGYEISVKGETYRIPKKDLFVQRQFVEDIHLNSPRACQIQEHLQHWSPTRDYYGPSWAGVEMFHYELAKVAQAAAIESPGWYRYPSSKRDGMDGKNWRLVVPTSGDPVAVNCHSMLHDHVWTLTTSVYSTRDIDLSKVKVLGHPDFWTRILLWTLKVALVLQQDGYDYSGAVADLTTRLRKQSFLQMCLRKLLPIVEWTYRDEFGEASNLPEVISVGCSRYLLDPGSIAANRYPSDVLNAGVITISPEVIDDEAYVVDIIKHELIHAALGDERVTDPHGEKFQRLADRLKLPRRYQD